MTALSIKFDYLERPHPLKTAFLKWQCRVRQIAMREKDGQPDDGIMPALRLPGDAEPLGHIITILNKNSRFSVTSELVHMATKTNDPAQRREQALRFFSAAHYQKHREFSDILTSTFPPQSEGAARIAERGSCILTFEAYSQRFDLPCATSKLEPGNALYRATIAHNFLFNPNLSSDAVILAFQPDWDRSSADPNIGGG